MLSTSAPIVGAGSAVTFTAALSGAGATPTGTVTFLDGAAQLGSGTVDGSGTATVTTSTLAVGAHSITASYGGDTNYSAITSTALTETVIPSTGTALAVTLAGSPVTTVAWGNAVTLTASVQAGGVPVTAGTVDFCDATAPHCTDIHLLGAAQLTSAGTAAIKFVPGIGSHSYKAIFAGTSVFGSSASSAAALSVTGLYPTSTIIAQSGNVGNYTLTATVGGTGPATPAGTVSFLDTSNSNAVLGAGLLGAGVSALNFVTASNPADSSSPASIAVGDFNGDGIQDMAVANFGDNTVTVFLGDGTGNFTAAAASPATGGNPIAVVAGDFNGDGILDLAVANYKDNTVTVLLGKGDGSFTAAAASPATGLGPNSIVAGDFNSDGKMDLSVANINSNSVTVLPGNGDGTFTAAATPATGFDPYSVAVGDFNGDGIPDLAAANYGSITVTVLLGKGDGTFTPAMTSPEAGNNPYSIAVGDFNGDGRPDLAIANYNDVNLTVLITASTQAATATVSGIAPIGAGTHLVAAAYPGDSNYNSSLSAPTGVAGQTATTTTLALSSGGSPVKLLNWGSPVTLTATVQANGTPVTTGRVNFCDATAAHCTDIHLLGTAQLTSAGTAAIELIPAVGSHSYKAVFAGTTGGSALGTASASPVAVLTVTGTTPTITTIAQSGNVGNYTLKATVTGAGRTAPTGTVSFIDTSSSNALVGTAKLGTGTAALSFLNPATPGVGHSPASVAIGDFNGDGIQDLALTGYSGTVTVLLGNGDGTFKSSSVVEGGPFQPSIAVGDFNGDGKVDLATVSYFDSTVTVLLGNGDGTFTPTATSPQTGRYPLSLAVGDFNGDGTPDLAVATGGGQGLTVLLGKGDGTFMATATSPQTGNSPAFVAVGDFNRDGVPDLAVANEGSNNITVLLGKGDGTFAPMPLAPATGDFPIAIAVGDFNGDGFQDLAAVNQKDWTVTFLLGNGDGTFKVKATSPRLGYSPQSIAMGDFNGDGVPDLALASLDGTSILLGNGDGTFTAAASGLGGYQPFSVAAGDFNGDGISDLAVANQGDSTVTVLLAQTQVAAATATGISPPGTGTHQVAASYLGDTKYSPSISGTVGLTAQLLPPRMTLTSSTTATTAGKPVTLTAAVLANTAPPKIAGRQKARPMASSTPVATGTVTFYNGAIALGTGTLNSKGIATFATTSLPAGKDSITSSYPGDSHFSATTSSPVSVTVAQGTQTIAFAPLSKSVTYGVSPIALSATASSGLLVSFAVTGPASVAGNALSMTGAGSVTVTASQAGNSNYYAATAVSQTIVVSKASLTVTGNNARRVYGVANPNFAATITDFVNGDKQAVVSGTPTLTTAATLSSPVGSYPITPSQGTLAALNYTFRFVNGALTVIQAKPEITWAIPSPITYGTALSGTQLNASASASGAFAYNPGVGKVLTPGTYVLSTTFTPTDGADYQSASASVKLTVNPALLTVTASSPSVIYGAAVPTITPSYVGFVNGDTAASLSKAPACSTVYTIASKVGSSPATTCSGAAASNYTIKYVAGSVTITQATPTITWAAPSAVTYGTALIATQLNASLSVAGSCMYTPGVGTVLPAGAQKLTANCAPTDATDYKSASASVTLTVTPAQLTVKADNKAMTYRGTVPTLTGTLSGVVNGDKITASYSTAGTSSSPAGAYPITAKLSDPGSKLVNYKVTNTSGTLTIGKVTSTVNWATPAAITYGTALSATQLDATASVAGTFTYTPSAGTVPKAGKQTLSVAFKPTDSTDYLNEATERIIREEVFGNSEEAEERAG
jgi:hypothetical protein